MDFFTDCKAFQKSCMWLRRLYVKGQTGKGALGEGERS